MKRRDMPGSQRELEAELGFKHSFPNFFFPKIFLEQLLRANIVLDTGVKAVNKANFC